MFQVTCSLQGRLVGFAILTFPRLPQTRKARTPTLALPLWEDDAYYNQ